MKKIIVFIAAATLFVTGGVNSAKAEGFTDVSATYQFYEHINYLAGQGVIKGKEGNRFAPDDVVTRAEAAVMIARALDLPTEKRATIFPDVSSQSFASGAIQSANDEGIIKGYTDGNFKPDETVTRGEMAIFLTRAFKLTEEEPMTFTDVPVSSAGYAYIPKIIAAGVTQGYSETTFAPNNPVTRAQFSAFLARATNENLRLTVHACGYNPASKVNPDRQTLNCLVTKAARNANVPPEIAKAIVEVESGWKHFLSNGEPLISEDNGIGLMQLTNRTEFDTERLKYDIAYNIESGIKVLSDNFVRTDLPIIGTNDRNVLEHWYFAVMAYNGTKPMNSPFYQATGERNLKAYQEKVYSKLSNGFVATNIKSINMSIDDFTYDGTTTSNIEFNKKAFTMTGDNTISAELLKEGSVVNYTGKGLRSKPSSGTDSILTEVTKGSFTIIGGPVYDMDANSPNQYIWYPVKTTLNGKVKTGFIAAPYIQ
ncbi:S-layer homology domain-containing protein [Sporosarcina thermotolerans]|uniref:S-layer homology domain-containing protein n=1 Tax=Sporosarcina thermotolerans TaxID=633404 RepID=A0AAW9AAV9_9BACL|nr:S-layer homology domain-containing protein [Sporosarcina thermotolerans]MDW0116321.1 S-layer homology domain-containing protein [Sporosarcina thermotolerans]WHT48286.1 S-layer homology domain-containing protein [Sporosarcina thermotolerans]